MQSGQILRITPVSLRELAEIEDFRDMSRAYFEWMDGEIERVTGQTLAAIVGMDREAYVQITVDAGCRLVPDHASLFFIRDASGAAAAMGGLRTLPDGAAEIVRIYTRPAYRGLGCGALMVRHLIEEAGRAGHPIIRLDTGVFMRSAQKIYDAAGFVRRGPYEGAEPPPVLQPHWIYMERPTTP
jgi:GNAT superfamily N-acetyltransferase